MIELTPEGLQTWIAIGSPFVLVDVREALERAEFSLGGLHIPLGDLMQRRAELPLDVPLVFYCAKGIRSGIACQRLGGLAHSGALYNLSGGVAAWQKALGPRSL